MINKITFSFTWFKQIYVSILKCIKFIILYFSYRILVYSWLKFAYTILFKDNLKYFLIFCSLLSANIISRREINIKNNKIFDTKQVTENDTKLNCSYLMCQNVKIIFKQKKNLL